MREKHPRQSDTSGKDTGQWPEFLLKTLLPHRRPPQTPPLKSNHLVSPQIERWIGLRNLDMVCKTVSCLPFFDILLFLKVSMSFTFFISLLGSMSQTHHSHISKRTDSKMFRIYNWPHKVILILQVMIDSSWLENIIQYCNWKFIVYLKGTLMQI